MKQCTRNKQAFFNFFFTFLTISYNMYSHYKLGKHCFWFILIKYRTFKIASTKWCMFHRNENGLQTKIYNGKCWHICPIGTHLEYLAQFTILWSGSVVMFLITLSNGSYFILAQRAGNCMAFWTTNRKKCRCYGSIVVAVYAILLCAIRPSAFHWRSRIASRTHPWYNGVLKGHGQNSGQNYFFRF